MESASVGHLPAADLHSTSDQALLSTLATSLHTFLQPPPSLHAASLVRTPHYLDHLAKSTSDTQLSRQQLSRRKRKRGEPDALGLQKPLQLKEIHLKGFQTQQVWEQARRVIGAGNLEAQRDLDKILLEQKRGGLSKSNCNIDVGNGNVVRFKDITDDGDESDNSASQDVDMGRDELVEEDDASQEEPYTSSVEDLEVDMEGIEDEDLIDEDDVTYGLEGEFSGGQSEFEEESRETFVPDKLGLNDGFFSIDDFNRQSEFLEQQDARGANDDAASDEEEVDWGADPLASGLPQPSNPDLKMGVGEESADEEDGPTFGNADLDGPDLSDSEDDSEQGVQMEDIGAMNNTNDIKYAEFFAPPPRKASKNDRRRALPKTQPPPSTTAPRQETDDDLQRTISAVRRDIFEDDLTPDEDAPDENTDPRSSHQKRQAALTVEIRRLEAASVAKRDWTLFGEARAADRPINSLLEEDLDFERAGKPIPVITQEVSEDIEALIKRRIVAREFDEVIRRRPGNLATGGDVRRGRFELDDTKPQQSLAEMYEADHLRTVDPEGYSDKRDEKLKKEHAKIEQMWKDVSAKLDALSSWHYKPKPPSASINVVVDVPTISMEDARPSAGGDVGGESMLAPQEVYKAGEARNKREEVVTGSGLPVGREEMTRDEKTRRRRREKERIRKAGGLAPTKGGKEAGKKTKEKQGVIGDLKKGGVRVIGKKGEIRDVEGRAVTEEQAVGRRGGGFKL